MLEAHDTLDQCEVGINPQNVQLPTTLELSLGDDGAIYLGDQMIVPPCDDGRKGFSQIKEAFKTGRYKLIISSRGQIKLAI